LAACTLRLGLGRYTTESEVDFAIDTLAAAVRRLAGGGGVTSAAGGPT
jgi:cysteine sulfinate desulfinase/cysteine desulfurase-like protein